MTTNELETMTPQEMREEMRRYLNGKPEQAWHWIHGEGGRINSPRFTSDDRVIYDGDHAEIDVLRALVAANRRQKARRSAAARKAAETRRERREAKVYRLVRHLEEGGDLPGPRQKCSLCGKGLGDPSSIKRGIGSDCWQDVLRAMTANM